jgi:hypothetical protein
MLIFQGNIALATDHFDIALNAFRKAQNLKADLRSYQGHHLNLGIFSASKLSVIADK